jgi:NAD+ diphosphatase
MPRSSDVAALSRELSRTQYLGAFRETGCFVAELDDAASAPPGMLFQEFRPLVGLLSDELFSIAGRAYQILYWDRTHQFCGRCGARTHHKKDERAKECPRCGLIDYPVVSPAIIVAIVKDRKILLARARRFTAQFYSVLAGFVETGETLEECVKREVKEEVGLDVDSITYFGSQPWPFPNSLMVAFTAKHAGGEIGIDATEIVDAQWFNADRLPDVPRKGTIARRLIDWFVEKSGQENRL